MFLNPTPVESEGRNGENKIIDHFVDFSSVLDLDLGSRAFLMYSY